MTTRDRNPPQLPVPLACLSDARSKLSEVYAALDAAGQLLDEPERGAALELKTQVGDLLRRLGNLIVFAGIGR